MHLSEDCVEFSNYYRAKEVVEKYCGFMPYEIYISEKDTDKTETIKESERKPSDIVIEEIAPKEDASSDEKKEKQKN
jgi:molecular chaperone HtpG